MDIYTRIRIFRNQLWLVWFKLKYTLRNNLYPIIRLFYVKRINDKSIPNDEFDSCLDMDLDLMLKLNKSDREVYINNLIYRRNEAHYRDMERSDVNAKATEAKILSEAN